MTYSIPMLIKMDIPSISWPLFGQRHNTNYSSLGMDEPFGFVEHIKKLDWSPEGMTAPLYFIKKKQLASQSRKP